MFFKEAANLKTQRNYSIFHRTPYFIYLFTTHEAAKNTWAYKRTKNLIYCHNLLVHRESKKNKTLNSCP